MARNKSGKWSNLTDLLGGSFLEDVRWDPGSGTVRLALWTHRSVLEVSTQPEWLIELFLSGVEAVAIAHGPQPDGVTPSPHPLSRWVGADDLLRWEFPPEWSDVHVNDPQAEENVRSSDRVDWVLGRERDLDRCDLRVAVSLEDSDLLGLPSNDIRILFAGRKLVAASRGDKVELDADSGAEPLASWWTEWNAELERELHELTGTGGDDSGSW